TAAHRHAECRLRARAGVIEGPPYGQHTTATPGGGIEDQHAGDQPRGPLRYIHRPASLCETGARSTRHTAKGRVSSHAAARRTGLPAPSSHTSTRRRCAEATTRSVKPEMGIPPWMTALAASSQVTSPKYVLAGWAKRAARAA